jgi:RND family efflux transporter MFP subunit
MKRLRVILSYVLHHKKRSAIVFVILVVLGFVFFPKSVTPLETAKVKRDKLVQSISATGTIDSETSVNLNFLTGGKLVYVGAKKGDEVKAGQTLAVLDQRTLQRNLQQTLREFSKQKNAFDTTQNAYQNHTPQDALNDSMRRILENNQYDLDKSVTSVELQQLTLEQSVLTTPVAGILVRADAQVAGVNIGATTTFTVADPANLIFKMDVDESDIGKITPGQTIDVSFDAFPEQTITLAVSEIDFISHKSDTGGNVYTVQAKLPDNADQRYRIGMSGDAQIVVDRRLSALIVPLGSVIDEKYVYVKTEKSFEKRKLKLGLINDTDAEIISGLKEGDEVAVDPEAAKQLVEKKSPFAPTGAAEE